MTKNTCISVIITCHSEGIILHKTILSVLRSAEGLPKQAACEIIVHADCPTSEMTSYLATMKTTFPDITLYTNEFHDPGISRDFCIKRATGRYIALIDGDDLFGQSWLSASFAKLESLPYGEYVAHSDMVIEFGDTNSIIQKRGEVDKTTDTLLSIWSGRWNSIIIAPSNLLKKTGYPSNKPGFGYEDWFISCTFIEMGVHNITVPETVVFVRRKTVNSVWAEHSRSMCILPAHPIFSFKNIRSLGLPTKALTVRRKDSLPISKKAVIDKVKNRLIGTSYEKYARKLYEALSKSAGLLKIKSLTMPTWLSAEWLNIHKIEKSIFPTRSYFGNYGVYEPITKAHYMVGHAYQDLVALTEHDKYDYIIFVPWLSRGGADLFAINYANSICSQNKDKHVAVIATEPDAPSTWQSRLDPDVDFINFGAIAGSMECHYQNRLLEQFIENSGATHLHIINSLLAYNFIRSHTNYIKGTDKKIIVTSFSQSTDSTGRIFGYSHTHVPEIYELASIITTDNQAVIDMWISEYGFDKKRLRLHRQPIDIEAIEKRIAPPKPRKSKATQVLWAARFAPEKLPQLVPKIGQLLKDKNIKINMYGCIDKGYDASFLKSLPNNIKYRGPFTDFFSLPLRDFDIYLYTSLFDGMPNALLETSTAKLPIIASAVGGIPEFIGDKNGILIEDIQKPQAYANAIIKLSKDIDLRNNLINNAYSTIRNEYNSDAHQAAVKEMLEKLDY